MTLPASVMATLSLLLWAALWLLGGRGLTRAAFRLSPKEEWVAGIAVGWIVQNWLANLVARLLPVAPAFWLSAVIVFAAGVVAFSLSGGWKDILRTEVPLLPLFMLTLITAVMFNINRGLAIFDDFQHLPAISLMAAGDFPPHFPFDPKVIFGYHHFLQLFSAQIVRVSGVMPWVAVDAARALSFALAIVLAFYWAERLTHSKLAGVLGSALVAFGSGTRWLLLFLPGSFVDLISKHIQLIGSGSASGKDLASALARSWAVEGGAQIPFPFAFANGIFPAGVIQALTANGLVGFVIIFLLLLSYNRWRNWLGAVLSMILVSVWGLLGEAELPGMMLGWGLVVLFYVIQCRSLRLPRALWVWLGVIASGCLIGFLEGGALTDILTRELTKITGGTPPASYQTVGFELAWPPAVVSSHLGVLPLIDPGSLLVALLEIGPILIVFPLVMAWGVKAFRNQRWYEAGTVATAVGMLLMLFVQFNGSTGVRNTPRLYVFVPILAAFAIPLVWIWVSHRSATTKWAAAVLGFITLMGGLVMFGVELTAAQQPVYSYFITDLDARMAKLYWNRLEPGSLVFDYTPYRATTLFGRATDSSYTIYQTKPEWDALARNPDPVLLHRAGFDYLYMDNKVWQKVPPINQHALSGGCVKLMKELYDNDGNFRWLIDLRACQ